ncbi:helix-turn-helix transcriptional regulator [Succinivibrio dextrinosolvens]|uniref:helix-turn-helix transcriptional regulator n=1 Tax=Succinivibrio dextrinosolvens TaxID=83771 RepID=UPI00241F0D36|nr:helix-turn-helix domain-containing protein [Succinivibrio dextrinosolvens]MBE6422571.1 helix-turn-helix domain-containing protein [Succinivibrio dextrinosolvens]
MSSINRKSIELADLKENVTNYSLQNCNNLSDLVNKDPDSYLLDAKKISELFNIHIVSVYRWKAAGLLPDCVKIKRRLYWRLSDIRAFIASQMNNAI